MTAVSVPGPETLLCDTSYLAHSEKARARPHLYRHWVRSDLDRISAAYLAITPFTLAEVRVGYTQAGWGAARITAIEHALASFVLVPMDEEIMTSYVNLKCSTAAAGRPMGFHDCWIAATAIAKNIPLVSSDLGHCDVPGLETIYFPASTAAAT